MAYRTPLLILATFLIITTFFLIPSRDSPSTPALASTFDIKPQTNGLYEDDTTTTITTTKRVTRTRTQTHYTTATRSRATYTAKSMETASPVPVEMFVMSKCPDAAYCIHELVLPLMANISAKMNLTPTFIGTLDEGNGGVTCMHGQSECLGNIIELCVHSIYSEKPYIWLPFFDCLSADISLIPQTDHVHGCAKEHGVDFEALNRCASDMESEDGGGEMLRRSVSRAKELGVRASCTVQIKGETRCVRDGGKWDRDDCDVESVMKDIEKAYGADALMAYGRTQREQELLSVQK